MGAKVLKWSLQIENNLVETLGDRDGTLRCLTCLLNKWIVTAHVCKTGDSTFCCGTNIFPQVT